MAKSIFAGTVEKTGNNRQKPWQKPIFCGSGRLHYFDIIKVIKQPIVSYFGS